MRDSGYRFGMKLWQLREIRWNRKLHCDPGKVMQVCCNLGLQWTRAQLGQKEHMDTDPELSGQRGPEGRNLPG